MNYRSFIRQFETRVLANIDSYQERLNYVFQYTIGEPHRIAKEFSYLNSEAGYNASIKEFEERCGDADILAHSYVKRALDWPIINQDDGRALDDYSIFLTECNCAIENVEAARILKYSENLKLLVKKLPFYLHEKWRNIAFESRTSTRHLWPTCTFR